MEQELQRIKNKHKNIHSVKEVKDKKNTLYINLMKVSLAVLISLVLMIFMKGNSNFKKTVYNEVYEKNISFAYINSLYKKYFGSILPFEISDNKPVFSEKLEYKDKNNYLDGVVLTVKENYLIPNQVSGLVVFIGEKEGYGKTVIIQQTNGIDLWYGNLENVAVKLYDYIESGTLLGEASNSSLYLVYKKEGKVLDYEDYL